MYENVILVVVVMVGLIFGVKKIPEVARNLGKVKSEFKKGNEEK